MLEFTVHSVGKYNKPEINSYTTPYCTINFNIDGLRWYRYANKEIENPGVFISVLPGGVSVGFEYSTRRSNWGILLETDSLQLPEQSDILEINYQGHRVSLAVLTPIKPEDISELESEFARIYNAFKFPTPANRLRCKLGVCSILRYLIDHPPDSVCTSPGAKLKLLIDENPAVNKSLEDLSRACGYSADHLRSIFQKEYGLKPHAYRNQVRMALAVDMMSNSDLSITQISTQTGFQHVSHFCRMFKNIHHMTPSEGIKRLRCFSG